MKKTIKEITSSQKVKELDFRQQRKVKGGDGESDNGGGDNIIVIWPAL